MIASFLGVHMYEARMTEDNGHKQCRWSFDTETMVNNGHSMVIRWSFDKTMVIRQQDVSGDIDVSG